MNEIEHHNNKRHFCWLDLIRFLAALVVVIVHARHSSFVDYRDIPDTNKHLCVTVFYALTRVGGEAVVVFFVLSGFLVGGRSIEKMTQNTFKPADYAIDRFVRIALPLFPALVFTSVSSYLITGQVDLSHLLGNMLSLQGVCCPPFGGNRPLWSLSYEVWLYVATFAAGLLSTGKKFHLVSMVLLTTTFIVFTHLNFVFLLCWLLGALAYSSRPTRKSWANLLASLLFLCGSLICTQLRVESKSVQTELYTAYFPSIDAARLILACSVAILIRQLICIKPSSPLMRRIDLAGTSLSVFSYTLYLTHYPVLSLIEHFHLLSRADSVNVGGMIAFLLSVFTCIACGWCLYLLFEKHTVFFKMKLRTLLRLRTV